MIEKLSINSIQACNIFYTKFILLIIKAKNIIFIMHTNVKANNEIFEWAITLPSNIQWLILESEFTIRNWQGVIILEFHRWIKLRKWCTGIQINLCVFSLNNLYVPNLISYEIIKFNNCHSWIQNNDTPAQNVFVPRWLRKSSRSFKKTNFKNLRLRFIKY